MWYCEKDNRSRIARAKKAFMDKTKLFSSSLNLDIQKRIIMLCLECGTTCGRDLDSDITRQEMVRSL